MRVVAVAGSPGPVPVTIPAHAAWSGDTPQCVGEVIVDINGKGLRQGGSSPGEASADFNLQLPPGEAVPMHASAQINCGGCFGYDQHGVPFGCHSGGQAVADPTMIIDPRWPHASEYRVEQLDVSNGTWHTFVPPVIDIDSDGHSPPEDCKDLNPLIHPGAVEVPDDGIDQDCNGGDARVGGSALSNGSTCANDLGCQSGSCVEGICCESRCGNGSANDCQSCLAERTGRPDGICAPLALGTLCRPAAHLCDDEERCDGTRLDCPVDGLKPIGQQCRPSVGSAACDPPEFCAASFPIDGSFQSVCPADVRSSTPECVSLQVPASSSASLLAFALFSLATGVGMLWRGRAAT